MALTPAQLDRLRQQGYLNTHQSDGVVQEEWWIVKAPKQPKRPPRKR